MGWGKSVKILFTTSKKNLLVFLRGIIMNLYFLSSSSALFLLLLHKAGGICTYEVLPVLMGSTTDINFILNECKNIDIIDIDNDKNVILKKDIDIYNIINSFNFFPRNYSYLSMAFCVSLFINKDYQSFLNACNKIIYNHYLNNNIEIMYICYEIIAKMILKIKITNEINLSYVDFISIVKNIQKYATRVLLHSKYVFYIFYKIKACAYYIGDMRTIYFVNLSLGAFNVISKDLKKIIKNHNLMKTGVDGIFSLKDEELVIQYVDLISLFYLLNGEYKKGISFYTSIMHRFSNSQEDLSIFLRSTFFASLCALYTTMYKKADYFIINSIKRIDDATIFEKN